MSRYRVGISGWTYAPWRGVFYPEDLVQKRELEYAASVFNSIEINGSFYSLQRPESYQRWAATTPKDFVFAVKGGRYITHMKKLVDVDSAVANFFASGLLHMGARLGPILWQLPPQLRYRPEVIEAFLEKLPRSHRQAANRARHHDQRLQGRAWFDTQSKRPVRHAMEVRHPSFMDAQFIEQLRRHDVALVLADSAGKFPYSEDMTTDFVYIRLHGSQQLYTSGYADEELDWWARRIRTWAGGGEPRDAKRLASKAKRLPQREVFVYFDNDAKVHAPFDARSLAVRLGVADEPLQRPA